MRDTTSCSGCGLELGDGLHTIAANDQHETVCLVCYFEQEAQRARERQRKVAEAQRNSLTDR